MSQSSAYARAVDAAKAQHGDLEGEEAAKASDLARQQIDAAFARLLCREAGIPEVKEDEDGG